MLSERQKDGKGHAEVVAQALGMGCGRDPPVFEERRECGLGYADRIGQGLLSQSIGVQRFLENFGRRCV